MVAPYEFHRGFYISIQMNHKQPAFLSIHRKQDYSTQEHSTSTPRTKVVSVQSGVKKRK